LEMSRNYKYGARFYLLFFLVLGLELKAHTLSHPTTPFGDGFFWGMAGLEPWSSWSLPPEQLGLQAWATATQLCISLKMNFLSFIFIYLFSFVTLGFAFTASCSLGRYSYCLSTLPAFFLSCHWGSNPEPCICWASALPLSYIPSSKHPLHHQIL
jgi:hypothetical protein